MAMRMKAWTVVAAMAGWMTVAAGAQTLQVPQARYRLTAMPAAAGQSGEAAPKDDLFAGTEIFEKGATNVTEINMTPDSLNLVGGSDGHKAHNMILNVVRTYQYDKPGMYNMADVDTFRNKLNSGDWHCSVHTRDLKTGESTDICSRHRTDDLKETAIISVEPKQLTFIHTIRREGGPGSSELGAMPMLFPGMGPMTNLAMLDPEAFADMQIGLHSAPMIALPKMKLDMEKQLKINGPEMQKQMKAMQKQLQELKIHPPQIDPKQMEALKKQMEELRQMQPVAPSLPEPPAVPEPAKP